MAHTKSQGAVSGNRDSRAKRLGIKVYGGAKVNAGNIVVRQKGTKFFPGEGMRMGNDFTLYSVSRGIVQFKLQKGKKIVEIING